MKLLAKKDKKKEEEKPGKAATDASTQSMSRINLLPWRAELRQERQVRFGAITGVCLLITALGVLGTHMYMQDLIDYHNSRNAYLSEEIKKADKKIAEIKDLRKKREQLIARMEVIQKLQSSRPEVVHLFEEMATTLPEGVYYKSFVQKGKGIDLKGVAQSGARVSRLMRNLKQSAWLKSPILKETQRKVKDKRQLHEFSLSITQDAPKKKTDEEDDDKV